MPQIYENTHKFVSTQKSATVGQIIHSEVMKINQYIYMTYPAPIVLT